MKKLWSELPNAHHIDWVLKSLKENRTSWAEAFPAWDDAVNAAFMFTMSDTKRATRRAACDAAMDAAWATAGDVWLAAQATSSAIVALIVYDDCDQYLAMGYEKLLVLYILSEKPQALLLLPMAYVLEKINEKVLV